MSQQETFIPSKHGRYEKILSLAPTEQLSWLSSEEDFWKKILSTYSENARADHKLARTIEQYINDTNTARTLYTQHAIEHFVSSAPAYDFPFHDDPISEYLNLSAFEGSLAPALLSLKVTIDNDNKHYLRGYNTGYTDQEIEITRRIAETANFIESKKNETITALSEKEKQAIETVEKIVAAATKAITLSEPVKFWEERRSVHQQNAKKYEKRALNSALIFGVLLLATIIYEYSSGTPFKLYGFEFTLPKSNFGLAFLILITSSGIWAIRVFIKLMMANLALEIESLERSTMIKTFVAMTGVGGNISNESQMLFFTTLFRPSNNSISEDSTAPEFSKLLESILQNRKSN